VTQLQGAVVKLQTAVHRIASCIHTAGAADLAEGLIQIHQVGMDPLQAAFTRGLRQFDKAGGYQADGAPSAVALEREQCNLSVGAAAAVPA
jgi:hypothetical protein